MRSLAFPLVFAAGLAACAPTSAPQGNRDSGIAAWDRKTSTLWVDGTQSYSVPAGVSTHGMMNGDTVTVTWQDQGGQRVASSISVDRRRRDAEQN